MAVRWYKPSGELEHPGAMPVWLAAQHHCSTPALHCAARRGSVPRTAANIVAASRRRWRGGW